jgi:hypothetical protein
VKFKDYYAILGVESKATALEIKRAYQQLAKKHHPDVNPGDEQSVEKFKAVTEAYHAVADPAKRLEYDEWHRAFYGQQTRRPTHTQKGETSQDAVYAELIGISYTTYYRAVFEALRTQKYNWNWFIFLFAPLWFIYRRMYIWGWCLLLVPMNILYILSVVLPQSWAGLIYLLFIIATQVCAGLWGNYLYLRHIQRLYAEIRQQSSEQGITTRGGVDIKTVTYALAPYAINFLIIILYLSMI